MISYLERRLHPQKSRWLNAAIGALVEYNISLKKGKPVTLKKETVVMIRDLVDSMETVLNSGLVTVLSDEDSAHAAQAMSSSDSKGTAVAKAMTIRTETYW